MRMLRIVPVAVAAAAVLAAGAAAASQEATLRTVAARTSAAKPNPGQFLRVHAARRAVVLTLIAADGPGNNGFNFDGYGRGELLVTVPRGWRVTIVCKNGSPLPNSCAVISGPRATAPAFKGAATPHPVAGLQGGQSATFTFTAGRVGVYRIASVVPGHEQARMYAVLAVTRGGKPSISARPGP